MASLGKGFAMAGEHVSNNLLLSLLHLRLWVNELFSAEV